MERYSGRGVSAQKEDVHNAVRKLDKGLFPNAFVKVLPDYLAGEQDYCNVIHADGAGTKSSLAYAYWKETGDIDVWYGIAQDAAVMNTDDMLCGGITDNFIISNTIGRNKHLVSGEVVAALIEGFEKFAKKMKQFGINIVSGGGETADIGDLVRTVVVDTTVAARVKRRQIIDINIKPGDVILSLASFGQTIYEDSYNSGIGSNGLTSARHDIFNKKIAEKYPETFDPLTNNVLIYTGEYYLTDPVPGMENITMGKFVLSPTRTYLPLMKIVLKEFASDINGIIHNTGGGQTKVLKFVKNLHIKKVNFFDVPLLFQIIKEQSDASWNEMFQVFNMGALLEIYTNERTALKIQKLASEFNIDAKITGYTEKASENMLTIKNKQLEIRYRMQKSNT